MPDYMTDRIRIDRVHSRRGPEPSWDIYIAGHFIGREYSLEEAQERANKVFDAMENDL